MQTRFDLSYLEALLVAIYYKKHKNFFNSLSFYDKSKIMKSMMKYTKLDFITDHSLLARDNQNVTIRSKVIKDFNIFSKRYRYSDEVDCDNPRILNKNNESRFSIGDLIQHSLNVQRPNGNCRTCLLDRNNIRVESGMRILDSQYLSTPSCKIKHPGNPFHFDISFRISKASATIQISQVRIRTNYEFKSHMTNKFKRLGKDFEFHKFFLFDTEIDSLNRSSIRISFPTDDELLSGSLLTTLSNNGIDLLVRSSESGRSFLKNNSEDLGILLTVVNKCVNPLKYTSIEGLLSPEHFGELEHHDLQAFSHIPNWPVESIRCNSRSLKSFVNSSKGNQKDFDSIIGNIIVEDESQEDNQILLVLDESVFWRR